MAVNFNQLKQEILEEHNKVRANPKSYVPILKNILTYFKGDVIYKPGQIGVQTSEGQKVYNEAIKFLEKQPPVGKLILNENLSRAAQDHCNDIGPQGVTEHDGTDGSTVTDRVERYLKWDLTVAENLDFGGKTGEEVMVSLIVDDGNPDRGHRMAVFNKDLNIIGIGIAKHTEYNVCTCLDYVGAITKELGKAKVTDLGGIEAEKPTSKTTAASNNNNNNTSNTATTKNPSKSAIANNNKAQPKEEEPQRSLLDEINLNMSDKDFLFAPKKDLLANDQDKPNNAVSVKVKTIIKRSGEGMKIKVIKTYTLRDGSQEVLQLEERIKDA